jgi:hypothetical protein
MTTPDQPGEPDVSAPAKARPEPPNSVSLPAAVFWLAGGLLGIFSVFLVFADGGWLAGYGFLGLAVAAAGIAVGRVVMRGEEGSATIAHLVGNGLAVAAVVCQLAMVELYALGPIAGVILLASLPLFSASAKAYRAAVKAWKSGDTLPPPPPPADGAHPVTQPGPAQDGPA